METKKVTFEPAFQIGESVALVCDKPEERDKWIIVGYYVQKTIVQYVLSDGVQFITTYDYLIEEY